MNSRLRSSRSCCVQPSACCSHPGKLSASRTILPRRASNATGPAIGRRVIVDLNDLDPALVRNQGSRQIAQTACVDFSQRALARRVTAAGSTAHDALDMALHGVQRDIEHRHAKSVLPGQLGLFEGNGAAEGRLQRERGTSTDIPKNKLFKLAVHRRAHNRWDVLVGPSIQLRRTVICIEYVIGETRDCKE